MADKDLKKNIEKMEQSGYLQEDLKVPVGTFSLAGLVDDTDTTPKKVKTKK